MTMEERVAWLEAQVAALSVQTLASTAAPQGYYTSRYSGEEIDDILDKVSSSTVNVTIPATGWVKSGSGKYPYHIDIRMNSVTERTVANLTVLEESENTAISCGFAPRIQTIAQAVRFFSATVPSAQIKANLALSGERPLS